MPLDFTKVYTVGSLLLDCVCSTLDESEGGCPDRRCLVPGLEPEAINCCDSGGQLSVTIQRTFPSRAFPIADLGTPNNCDVPWQVAVYDITVFRCSPVGDVNVAPTCEQLDTAARINMSDMEAVRYGIRCCLIDRDSLNGVIGDAYTWSLGDHVSIQPGGGCTGTNLTVLVGIPTCWDC